MNTNNIRPVVTDELMTLKDLRHWAGVHGFKAKSLPRLGCIEVWPEGRKDLVYVASSTTDAFNLMLDHIAMEFKRALDVVMPKHLPDWAQGDDVREAFMLLAQEFHGNWQKKLEALWLLGHNPFWRDDERDHVATLQKIRNHADGFGFIAELRKEMWS